MEQGEDYWLDYPEDKGAPRSVEIALDVQGLNPDS